MRATSSLGIETRVDPLDGQTYTYAELREKYKGRYLSHEILLWWKMHCRSVSSLADSVAPLEIAWPSHWAVEYKSWQTMMPQMVMPPADVIEECCGPQKHFFLSYAMRTLPGNELRLAVQNARLRPPTVLRQVSRCRLRIINLPGMRGERRRNHIQRTCFDPLHRHFPDLDVGFTNGVVANDLVWSERAQTSNCRHFEKEACYNDQIYVADESLWHAPSTNEQITMKSNADQNGFIRELLHAFMKGEDEECSWGYTGCQIAHVEAWRDAYRDGVDWLMVCEDDVLPIPLFGMDWADVWGIVAQEVDNLQRCNVEWDLLYVGKGSATSVEGAFVTPLVVRAGYNLKMHCYCLSRRGLQRMLNADLTYMSIRPQDEILAALSIQGRHPRTCIAEKIRQFFPDCSSFQSLAFPFWGIVFQLQNFKILPSWSYLCDEDVAESAIHREGYLAARENFGQY